MRDLLSFQRVVLGAMLLALPAAARPSPRGTEPAAVAVRYPEGSLHGFLELRTAKGAVLASGDLLQVVRGREVDSRMVFHFADSSVFDETVTFTQQGAFQLQSYHLVQGGPAFERDLDARLARTGQYLVRTTSHKDGKREEFSGTMDLPPDVYNGMVITIAKNMSPRDTETVHMVAFTPKPRLIGLELTPVNRASIAIGQHHEAAVHLRVTPKLGAVVGFVASLLGKLPPDSDVWIALDGVPAFVRFEGPMYTGPVWVLTLATPACPCPSRPPG
jgi:hypothetical protein